LWRRPRPKLSCGAKERRQKPSPSAFLKADRLTRFESGNKKNVKNLCQETVLKTGTDRKPEIRIGLRSKPCSTECWSLLFHYCSDFILTELVSMHHIEMGQVQHRRTFPGANKGKVPVLPLTEHHVMKAYWGVEVQLHAPNKMPTARGVPKRSPVQVLNFGDRTRTGLFSMAWSLALLTLKKKKKGHLKNKRTRK
jgi:hypothetical protein